MEISFNKFPKGRIITVKDFIKVLIILSLFSVVFISHYFVSLLLRIEF